MIWIAHRGNVSGPNKAQENEPSYLRGAIRRGFQVEADAWELDGNLWLGHDGPQYPLPDDLLHNPEVWWHAKNGAALTRLLASGCHTFSHDYDPFTLTSWGFIWMYPGQHCHSIAKSIAVLPENCLESLPHWTTWKDSMRGVCSDYVVAFSTGDGVCKLYKP